MRRLNPTAPVFLGQRELIAALDELVDSARRYVLLVSPYVRLGKLRNFGRTVEKALQRGVAVTLVVRAPDASTSAWDVKDEQEVERLVGAGLKLFEVPDLHAKVYVSDSCAIVTSINLVETSFNNSIELGVLVTKGTAEYEHLIPLVRSSITDLKRSTTPAALTSALHRSPGTAESAPSSRRLRAPGSRYTPLLVIDEDEDEDEDACFRCGRTGHWAEDCFARTTVDGDDLEEEEDDDY